MGKGGNKGVDGIKVIVALVVWFYFDSLTLTFKT